MAQTHLQRRNGCFYYRQKIPTDHPTELPLSACGTNCADWLNSPMDWHGDFAYNITNRKNRSDRNGICDSDQ